eukprot:c7782_g1_i1.p1 GENE.c7782_g1_i1~~c7782_g1_i1.p1  ORF type:complete len:339 (+),score=82.75 c7782_g1_i1:33-1049(+)
MEFDDISWAYERLKGRVRRTPVMTSTTLNRLTGWDLFFKCENFQTTGSFKYRGALNSVLVSFGPNSTRTTVTTHSSGNHGQALARAAQSVGVKAVIVVPSTASQVKKNSIAGYNAEVILCKPDNESREFECQKVVTERNAVLVHPSNEPSMICGHASLAIELLQQIGAIDDVKPYVGMPTHRQYKLDAILVPVGGGGLISGVALAIKALSPSTRVIGVEPLEASDAYQSKTKGKLVTHRQAVSVADGLLTCLGSHTWPIVRDYVDAIVTVTEQEIVEATQLVLERMKIVIEPSSGTSVAACLAERHRQTISGGVTRPRIGVVLCGGNLDLHKFYSAKY